MSEVDILGQIANLKEIDYNNTLMVVGIIELLIEKGIISKSELVKKVNTLDKIADLEINNII